MNLVVWKADREYEVAVEFKGPATVADLSLALGGAPAQVLWVDGVDATPGVPVAELGLREGSVVEVGGTGSGRAPSSDSGVLNRPPRMIEPAPVVELDPPRQPPEPPAPISLGWAALVVPVVLGLAMALLIHPRMAAFALFAPARLLAKWAEDRRRVNRSRIESAKSQTAQLQEFEVRLRRAQRQEVARRLQADCPPDVLLNRCRTAGGRLWERRRTDPDFMQVAVGKGCVQWDVPFASLEQDAAAVVDRYRTVHDVPVHIDLTPGAVVGLAGDRSVTKAIARQITLQAAVNHGPADLAISVLTESAREWDWAKWLPHVLVDAAGRRRVASTPAEVDEVVALLPAESGQDPHQLLIVDLPDLPTGRHPRVREAIQAGAASVIALADRVADLPSMAATLVIGGREESQIRRSAGRVESLKPWTVSASQMRRGARMLARIEDPEIVTAGVSLPAELALLDLVTTGTDLRSTVRSQWLGSGSPATAIGVAESGPLAVDLVADGPHALIGGTTGSGKSEMLRSLVAGLAMASSPEALNLVLVDYKGGSAFDACADLPHAVGVVTDLDEHLASRALICLEAELRYREQRLRDHGVPDLAELGTSAALPRLLVVVDEFAALAAELPDFMDALVGIAQRGRSLGVHLLLATQRPSGVIDDDIKANTNLRIALRMQDAPDSVDVIGDPAAVAIPRWLPGRALIRRGPSDVVPFHAASVSGHRSGRESASVSVKPFVFAHRPPCGATPPAPSTDGPSDLEQIVRVCCSVADEMGLAPVRSPWPKPLPTRIVRDEIEGAADRGVFALADEPHRQRVVSFGWEPGAGNLLLFGLPGSGTTTTLASLAVALAAAHDPERMHVQVVDCDDQLLMPLRRLPHVGSVIAGGDRERHLRLIRMLIAELERRRTEQSEATEKRDERPIVVTMIDNYRGFAEASDPGEVDVDGAVARLVADGPGLGMFTFLTAKQPADVPARIAAAVAGRLIFRLADRYDYSALGVAPTDPPVHPGRAIETVGGREIQVALPHEEGLAAAVDETPDRSEQGGAWEVPTLPSDIPVARFVEAGSITEAGWFLPLGIGDSTLRPAGLLLRDGDHALITGPPRSGKTTALLTAARVARQASATLHIAAIAPSHSGLGLAGEVDRLLEEGDLPTPVDPDHGVLLLIDDAEMVDESFALKRLLAERPSWLRVVAAGSADALRGLYGHWTQDLRRSRIGCVLRPDHLSDGDLWHTQLPRHHYRPFPAGRGYLLAAGRTELIQLGRP